MSAAAIACCAAGSRGVGPGVKSRVLRSMVSSLCSYGFRRKTEGTFWRKGLRMDDMNRNQSRTSGVVYRFGLFALDVSALSLTRNGVRIKLQDQPYQLLALLLEKSGQVVKREELRQRLWPGNTFVDFDKSLGVAVLKIRFWPITASPITAISALGSMFSVCLLECY